MHEWTTPADKQIVEIIDDEEKRMRIEFFLVSPAVTSLGGGPVVPRNHSIFLRAIRNHSSFLRYLGNYSFLGNF